MMAFRSARVSMRMSSALSSHRIPGPSKNQGTTLMILPPVR